MAQSLIQSAPKAVGGAVALTGAAAVYCQVHAGLQGAPAALEVSLVWGLCQATGWGIGGLAAFRLLRLAVGRPADASTSVGVAGAAALLTMAAGLASSSLWTVVGGGAPVPLDRLLFDLAPLAGGAGIAGGLVAWSWRREPIAVPEWLDLPEAGVLRLRTRDVTVIAAAGNYCELATATGPVLIRAPIGALAQRLAGAGFMRVHRGRLVNRARIARMARRRTGRCALTMDDGAQVPVGEAWREAVAAALAGSSRP